MVETQRPTASLSWDDPSSTLTLLAVPGDPGDRPIVDFTCRLDGAPVTECFDSPSDLIELVLSSGEHMFEVVVTDDRDNYTTESLTFQVVEVVPPTTTTTTTTVPTTTTTTTTTTVPPTTSTTSSTSTSVPPVTTTAKPKSGQPQVVPSGPLLPGAIVDFFVKLPGIKKGNLYLGVLRSTPVDIPATMATEDDQITFLNVTLPDDWDSGAHTLTIYNDGTDEELAVITLQDDGGVQPANTLPSAPAGDILPATGASGNSLLGPALVLLLLGAVLVLLARRRNRFLESR